ncbi:hypothetical protein [Aureibacter tunicatorum]|uniref:Uncharacterized protein n=1 Tax=Aureibacter tunicatorum TaxID=866807 RepID=A0AAE4BU83_9BACT|nr:hypothetical protein [Aureibacter tunicatorum]MDR6240775.1 hypothetical protein [Aureibacter tunicatorum]BDD06892.1 hypothetical protein AUTU_43750 [Aureibacter tunicatorum]
MCNITNIYNVYRYCFDFEENARCAKYIFVFIALFLFSGNELKAQWFFKKNKENTDNFIVNKFDKKQSKPKKVWTIYTKDTKGLLMWNKCFNDASADLGVSYVVIPKESRSMPEMNRFFHNLGVRTGMMFRAWPWWGLRVKRRVKQCKYLTADRTDF